MIAMVMSDKDIASWVAVIVILVWTLVRLHINHKSQSTERQIVFILYIGTVIGLVSYQYYLGW